MLKYIIDCQEINTEEDFWKAYISGVETEGEEYFGRNLDALWDALHAGGPGTPKNGNCFISIRNTESLKRIRGGAFYDHLRQIAYDLKSDPSSTISLRVN